MLRLWPTFLFLSTVFSVTLYIAIVLPYSNQALDLPPVSSSIDLTFNGSELSLENKFRQDNRIPDTTPPQRAPKITIIVIWSTRERGDPTYVPFFFQSVKANPQVDLVFINVDRVGKGCKNWSNAPNIKEVCLNDQEYYQLHVDFLCKRWECPHADRGILLKYLMDRARLDHNFSHFRILRSGIFERWIDPATTIWGWCDVDTFWGNFGRAFPWEVAHDFDIIAITSQPTYLEQRLLFTRGHMAFFRHSPNMLNRLHSYSTFNSLSSFLTSPPIHPDAEESEFSHFYFWKDKSFTFLHIEGMLEGFDAVLASEYGTFSIKNLSKDQATIDMRKSVLSLVRPNNRAPIQGVFTEHGVETEAVVKTEGFTGHRWFPEEFVVYVEPGWTRSECEKKAYFIRREPGAPVMQRLEPRERFLQFADGVAVDEGLYKHFQGEKYISWFHRLPAKELHPSETYAQWHADEAEIWDEEGDVVFKTGRDDN